MQDMSGLPWWGVQGGLDTLALKKLFVGGQGGSKNRSSPCERLDLRVEVLKLRGVKGLQGGREHSSD